MGKLKVIKSGALSTIQDKGRFGYRQFGIPQSGAIDLKSMEAANYLVGNSAGNSVVEFALSGMKLKAVEDTIIGTSGASVKWREQVLRNESIQLFAGGVIEILAPTQVYGYLGIGGMIRTKKDFGSYSTYLTAGFGGIEGRALKAGDIIETVDAAPFDKRTIPATDETENITIIRIKKGPEWNLLQEHPEEKVFTVDPSSNRMGVRLSGSALKCDGSEIVSSAVIPGTIQLPANGQPIILMNDCQTTGGYPRIGKVINEDMGKLAQTPHKKSVKFLIV